MARKRRLTETGRWIRTELDRLGWTQRELAERCGINYRVVNDVMVGCNRKPENIRRIKEALGHPGEKDAV
jgi:transcriptional regulator with XRE-family HTH domain